MAQVKTKATKTPGFDRLLSASRKEAKQIRTPWRYRSKQQGIKLTTAEKNARKVRRAEEKIAYHTALMKAYRTVQNEATLLHQQFGAHSVGYYTEEIFQCSCSRGTSSFPHIGW